MEVEVKVKYDQIISYCCGSYDVGDIGGVARFDNDLKSIFPNRKFFRGPEQKIKMLRYLNKCKNPLIITDNHLSCDIPNKYMTIIVHHGCAEVTAERNPTWGEPWKSLCTNGQRKMLDYRKPENTIFVSTSISCKKDFERIFGEKYTKFKIVEIRLSTEFDETKQKTEWNSSPIIIGSWNHVKKGENHIDKIKSKMSEYKFTNLRVPFRDNLREFFKQKQDGYLNCDIYLLLSNSEGTPYAALDAMACGLVLVATNVGIFEYDVPEDHFIKMDWKRVSDPNYVKKKVEEGWKRRHELGKKAREWYLKNSSRSYFQSEWKSLIVKLN